MKSKVTLALFSITALFANVSLQANVNYSAAASRPHKHLTTLAITAIALVAGYQVAKVGYGWIKEYIENKIIDKAAESIIIILTPHRALKNLPAKEKETILRKKARFLGMRKRILDGLQNYIKNEKNTVSPLHTKELESVSKSANLIFKAVDFLRNDNVYEEQYAIASAIDAVIENEILKSIIADTKPDSECNLKELAQKKQRQERKAKIITKVAHSVEDSILLHIINSSLFFNVLHA